MKENETVSIIKKIWRAYLKVYRQIKFGFADKLDYLLDSGFFGRYMKVCHYLRTNPFVGLFPSREAKELLKILSDKFVEIRPHYLDRGYFCRIGEFIPRYNIFVTEAIENKKNRILDVLPVSLKKGDINSRMVEVMRRNYTYIMDEERSKWLYVLLKFPNVDFSQEHRYKNRRDFKQMMDYNYTSEYWNLTEEEESEGKEKLERMGINGEFICFSNRDDEYLKKTKGNWFAYHDYRNSNIISRDKMVDFLNDKGIQCVRMGKYAKQPYLKEGVIDYAFNYYDALMDMYLSNSCKFFISDDSGINLLAFSYGKPQVFTNDVSNLGGNCSAYQGIPQRDDNLLIFKKIWYEKEDRFLSLEEIIDAQYEIGGNGERAIELGYTFIDNTDDEILEVVKEMYKYLTHSYVYSDEENKIQSIAKKILNKKNEEHCLSGSQTYIGRLGTAFLIHNRESLGL